MNLKKIALDTANIAKDVGAFIRAARKDVKKEDIEHKEKNSLVSFVDKEAEKRIVARLAELLPEATFITEESTVQNQVSELEWIVDPLDGTTNYLHNLPIYAVSIALRHQGDIVVGVIYMPETDEVYYAWQDGGAWLNGQQIHTSSNTDFKEALIGLGKPYKYESLNMHQMVLVRLLKETRGIRRMGAAAVDLAYTASGRLDAYFEYNLHIWDIAAGILLVKEAGGNVSGFMGSDGYKKGNQVVAGSPHVHSKLLDIIMPKSLVF